MGGIKNKLSKLSNKVKTLLSSLSLTERADERSSSGEVKTNKTKGSRLPSFSQPSKMPDGQIGNTRKLSYWGLYASKTIGSLRPTKQEHNLASPARGGDLRSKSVGLTNKSNPQPLATLAPAPFTKGSSEPPFRKRGVVPVALRVGAPLTSQRYDDSRYNNRISIGGFDRLVRITKYTSLACLTLAILSTLVLNIISSYSNSSTRSNAEPVSNSSTSTLANTANTELDPTGISISISSYPSSSSTGGNDANLSLSIPQGGGIATGRHTVRVDAGSNIGSYDLYLSSDSDETGLVNSEDTNTDTNTIPTTTGAIDNPSTLADKTYGYTLTNLDNNSGLTSTPIWVGLQPNTNPATIATIDDSDLALGQANTTTHNIYYGAKVKHPEQLLAGDYTADVVYTVVAELMPAPEVTDLVLNSSWTDDTPDTAYGSTSILTGENLNSVTGIYIDLNGNTVKDAGEEVTNLSHATDSEANTKLTFIAPTYTEEGQKNVYLEWPGSDPVKIENGWNYIAPSVCKSNNADMGGPDNQQRGGDCYVDIDNNMIPVYYTGDEQNPEWTIVDHPSGTKESGKWYDYSEGKWANAVTLRDDLSKGGYCVEGGHPQGYHPYMRVNTTSCPSGSYYWENSGVPYTPLEFAKEAMGGYMINGGTGGSMEVDDVALHPDDILGYWVYIPRYSYEVMRRDAIDLVQQSEDFKIKFETANTTKKVPVEGCSDANNPKSYRVGCGLNRTYTNTATDTTTNEVTNTTWATHPAFTWMDQDGNPVELNGIWVGKFETTGTADNPTILPNEYHLYDGGIGDYYDIAQSIGIKDSNNLYGNVQYPSYNNGKGYHNLSTTTSHMLKNSEWGAVAYLSASKYGAGVNKVERNDNEELTGRGPNDGIYNTSDGQKASTTNSIYGIYDTVGGASEYVMGGYGVNQSGTLNFVNAAKPPYVDLYSIDNRNDCTWNGDGSSCGGHALHETSYWGAGGSNAFITSTRDQWFDRGGRANYSASGIFRAVGSNGARAYKQGFRTVLMANQ